MPRKTRILHGDDEYLFVEAPGDVAGPALLIFARPDNRRAVAPGRTATHQSEHGLWVQVARFDGRELQLAPDPPSGLGERLKGMLPKYVDVRRERITQAKNACYWIAARGSALHALHPAQPAGILLKLWKDEGAARALLAELGEPGSVQSTGDLREFLELRAEEGFAGALIDPGTRDELVFFCLDETSHIQFLKVSGAHGGDEPGSYLLDEAGRWQPYEGEAELEPFVDPDAWDRLMARTYPGVPFLGYGEGWRAFSLQLAGETATLVDPEGDGGTRMAPLFHDPAAAEAFRSKHKLVRARIERVTDVKRFVRDQAVQGVVTRLHPADHRIRGGVLWLANDAVFFDGFAGIWSSHDGRTFTPSE